MDDRPRFERVLLYLRRLIGRLEHPTACVLGCGPVPQPLRILKEQGWQATGVDPVEAFVRNANEFSAVATRCEWAVRKRYRSKPGLKTSCSSRMSWSMWTRPRKASGRSFRA